MPAVGAAPRRRAARPLPFHAPRRTGRGQGARLHERVQRRSARAAPAAAHPQHLRRPGPLRITSAPARGRRRALGGGQLGRTRSTRLDVPAAAKARAFTSGFTAGLPELHLLRLTLSTSGGRVLSENTYWRHRTPETMRSLGGLPDARLTVTALGRTRKGDREEVRVRVGNRGRAVAAMTRLSLREARGGARVPPTLYSDNYPRLLPGESRTVTLSRPRTAAHADLTVRAEPFNGSPVSAGA
ncbi:hypothetical protein ACFY1V_13340 [Streptomyces sp. NPDC001255]|uniref:hypothetical protein n=1 Tax=Streptomyces sp. NPDC001255 TaxID=3364550 RepID=UPI003673ABF3